MQTIKVELPQLGKEAYVDVRDPRLLPWGIQKKLTASVGDSTEKAYEFAEQLTITLIRGGNLQNDAGVAFEYPLTEETIQEVPAVVIEAVGLKFAELRGQAKLPNE